MPVNQNSEKLVLHKLGQMGVSDISVINKLGPKTERKKHNTTLAHFFFLIFKRIKN